MQFYHPGKKCGNFCLVCKNVISAVFQGFENTLSNLELSNTDFESIPAAVCRLKVLNTLTLNNSPNLGKNNALIFDNCPHQMTTVTSLMLADDQLTKVPKFSTVFPNLQSLELSDNLLQFIDSTSLEDLPSLSDLGIGYNQFLSVPSAINRATSLQSLYAYGNKIQTVEDFDFLSLRYLTQVNLYGNPLIYVSPYAFTHSPLLNNVDLDSTMLDRVPRSIIGLKHLSTFSLSGRPIVCSCDAMSYLKAWNVSSISISATCSSGKSVKTYLSTDLPHCI